MNRRTFNKTLLTLPFLSLPLFAEKDKPLKWIGFKDQLPEENSKIEIKDKYKKTLKGTFVSYKNTETQKKYYWITYIPRINWDCQNNIDPHKYSKMLTLRYINIDPHKHSKMWTWRYIH